MECDQRWRGPSGCWQARAVWRARTCSLVLAEMFGIFLEKHLEKKMFGLKCEIKQVLTKYFKHFFSNLIKVGDILSRFQTLVLIDMMLNHGPEHVAK